MIKPLFEPQPFGEEITAMHEELQRRWAVHLQMIADMKAISWLVFWFTLAAFARWS